MKNPLWNNWQAKLMSFIIALVIWVFVKNQFDQVGFIDQVLSGTFTPGR